MNLFSDQRFVIALCLVALAVLSRTVFLQLSIGSSGITDNSTFVDNNLIVDPYPDYSAGRKNYQSNNRVSREQIAWIVDPQRDPFSVARLKKEVPTLASAMSPETQKPKSIRKPGVRRHQAPIVLPVLKALFHDSHDAQAVINGMLLETGDKVSGFNVLKITAEYVVLEKYGSRFTLYPG